MYQMKKSQELQVQINQLKNLIIQKEEILAQRESLLFSLSEKIRLRNLSVSILEYLKNYKLEYKKEFILNIINSALKDIFQDDIRINIEQEVKSTSKNIKYNITFYQGDKYIGKNDELLETNGGGVLSVISVLFKILIGYFYSKNKFYIFDESFAQVSPQYRERLSLFLRKFAEEYDFTLVLVSQTDDLNVGSHIHYQLNYFYENDLKTVFIEDKKTNLPNDKILNGYKVRIQNFQSIKDIEFYYKGFVVISGPNNCGKSASLRAIKALLFNDFKERFLRLGAKVSKIEFYKENEDGSFEDPLVMIYKSKKVIFEIEGEQYLGKNLADSVIKEAVSKLGFKHLDIKKLYKNIKGELRNQTEKIAYSSQYDQLFMVGSKSSDIEKVFNFLFNTENISLAISDFKNEIIELNQEIKSYDKEINTIKTELLQYQKDLKILELKFIIEYINELFNDKKTLETLRIEKRSFEDQLNNINKKIERVGEIKAEYQWLEYLKSFLNFKNQARIQKRSFEDQLKRKDELNKKIIFIEEFQRLNYFLNLLRQKRSFEDHLMIQKRSFEDTVNKIEKILNIKSKFNLIMEDKTTIENYLRDKRSLKDQIQKNNENLIYLKNKVNELDIKFHEILEQQGIVICPLCKGVKYVDKRYTEEYNCSE